MAKGKQKKRKRKIEEGTQPEIITRDEVAQIVFDHTKGLVKQEDLQPAVDSAVQQGVGDISQLQKDVNELRTDTAQSKTTQQSRLDNHIKHVRGQVDDVLKLVADLENSAKEDGSQRQQLVGIVEVLQKEVEATKSAAVSQKYVDDKFAALPQRGAGSVLNRIRALMLARPFWVGGAVAVVALLVFMFSRNGSSTDAPSPAQTKAVGTDSGAESTIPENAQAGAGLDWSNLDYLEKKYGAGTE